MTSSYFYVLFSILGLAVGSFVNVVVYRVPRGKGIIWGRSACPNCDKKLAWYDLIPVVSFLIIGGQCRNCGKPISRIYPLVELYSGFVFLSSFYLFAANGLVSWLFAVFVLEMFLILGLIDLRHYILPDFLLLTLTVGVAALAAIQKWVGSSGGWEVFAWSNFIGAALFFAVLFLIWFLSKGQWLGFGDVKLGGIVGFIFGFWGGLAILYVAIVLGALLGLLLLLVHRANLKTKLPLGSFICFSATFYMLGGDVVLDRFAPYFYSIPLILQ